MSIKQYVIYQILVKKIRKSALWKPQCMYAFWFFSHFWCNGNRFILVMDNDSYMTDMRWLDFGIHFAYLWLPHILISKMKVSEFSKVCLCLRVKWGLESDVFNTSFWEKQRVSSKHAIRHFCTLHLLSPPVTVVCLRVSWYELMIFQSMNTSLLDTSLFCNRFCLDGRVTHLSGLNFVRILTFLSIR